MGALQSGRPCPMCGSSDALAYYKNGVFCFSCEESKTYEELREEDLEFDDLELDDSEIEEPTKVDVTHRSGKQTDVSKFQDYPIKGLPHRGISEDVARYFGVRTDPQGNTYFPFYDRDNNLIGYKRKVKGDKKATIFIGGSSPKTPFGFHTIPESGKKILIVEGDEDAMAVAQHYHQKYQGRIYPIVALSSASNINLIKNNLDRIQAFEEVHLWLDNDEAGKKAEKKLLYLIGHHRCKLVKSKYHDPNDALTQGSVKEFTDSLFNVAQKSPASIVDGRDTWDYYKSFQNMEFTPWPEYLYKLNEKTYGRYKGSITMLAAGTGVGKSSFMKEDIYHLLTTTEEKIGMCFLEEDIGETVTSILSLHLKKRIGLPNVEFTEEEEKKAFDKTFGTGRLILLDHQGAVSDGSLINQIEYMAGIGCKYIYLDHITIAVSDTQGSDANSAMDKMMNELLKLTKRRGIWLGVVSHLRKSGLGQKSFETGGRISEDDLKGSGSLKQISFQTIAISRHKTHKNEEKRNISRIFVLKDRRTGHTGPAGGYKFNTVTGRLEDYDGVDFDNDDDYDINMEEDEWEME